MSSAPGLPAASFDGPPFLESDGQLPTTLLLISVSSSHILLPNLTWPMALSVAYSVLPFKPCLAPGFQKAELDDLLTPNIIFRHPHPPVPWKLIGIIRTHHCLFLPVEGLPTTTIHVYQSVASVSQAGCTNLATMSIYITMPGPYQWAVNKCVFKLNLNKRTQSLGK